MKKLVSILVMLCYLMTLTLGATNIKVYSKKDTSKYENLIKIELEKSDSKESLAEIANGQIRFDSLVSMNEDVLKLLTSINIKIKDDPISQNNKDKIYKIYNICYIIGSLITLTILILFWIFIKTNINWTIASIALLFLILIAFSCFEYIPKYFEMTYMNNFYQNTS
jgi:hypothetical protein